MTCRRVAATTNADNRTRGSRPLAINSDRVAAMSNCDRPHGRIPFGFVARDSTTFNASQLVPTGTQFNSQGRKPLETFSPAPTGERNMGSSRSSGNVAHMTRLKTLEAWVISKCNESSKLFHASVHPGWIDEPIASW